MRLQCRCGGSLCLCVTVGLNCLASIGRFILIKTAVSKKLRAD
jgi:hypothetical protein